MATTQDPSGPREAFLITLTAQGVGRKYRLGQATVIGRHPECDIQVVDPQTSKQHARIAWSDGVFTITDLESRNGVMVNGQRISATTRLARNDLVGIGEQAFVFDPDFDVLPETASGAAVLLVDDSAATVQCRTLGSGAASASPRTPEPLPSDGSAPPRRVGEAAADPMARRPGSRHFAADALEVLAADLPPADIVPRVMARLRQEIPCDGAALLACGPGDALEARYIHSRASALSVSRTLVSMAVRERTGLLVPDALTDSYLAHNKSIVRGKVRSVLLAPLTANDLCIGAAYLTRDAAHAFSDADLEALLLAAPYLTLALHHAGQLLELSFRVRRLAGLSSPSIVGEHPLVERLRAIIAKAARAPSTVLITGETGTGKELIARELHAQSDRAEGPFVAVNCGAIPEHLIESEFFGYEKGAFTGADRDRPGKLELASGGTLFLDEVGELSPALQVKLLRALEERSFYRVGGLKPVVVSVRLVAATNRDLQAMVTRGEFRADLFYRLNVLRIDNPPLRERQEDVEALARFFISSLARDFGRKPPALADAAVAALRRYAWPGNVRELRNVLERAVVLCDRDTIEPVDLPPEIELAGAGGKAAVDGAPGEEAPSLSLADKVAALERRCIVEAMHKARGKKAQAAQRLGISRPTLDKKLRDFAIDIFAEPVTHEGEGRQ